MNDSSVLVVTFVSACVILVCLGVLLYMFRTGIKHYSKLSRDDINDDKSLNALDNNNRIKSVSEHDANAVRKDVVIADIQMLQNLQSKSLPQLYPQLQVSNVIDNDHNDYDHNGLSAMKSNEKMNTNDEMNESDDQDEVLYEHHGTEGAQ